MSELKEDTVIKTNLKEVITVITFVVSILFGYFGIIKDIEIRLVRLETQMEALQKQAKKNDRLAPNEEEKIISDEPR